MTNRLCSLEALAKLNDAIFRAQYLIKIYASSQELRPEILSAQISQSIDVQDLQWLICQFEMADFSAIPEVEVRSRSALSGSNHRYIAKLNTVCLAADFVETASRDDLLKLFLQETIVALKECAERVRR